MNTMINKPYRCKDKGDSPIELAFMIFMGWVIFWLLDNVIKAGWFNG